MLEVGDSVRVLETRVPPAPAPDNPAPLLATPPRKPRAPLGDASSPPAAGGGHEGAAESPTRVRFECEKLQPGSAMRMRSGWASLESQTGATFLVTAPH